ncbi:MAG: ISSpo3, transposase [Parcubacteria group bacterium Gr01-1014_31]|nr:MAG: ISSpo3, transposase [Parcubacteria group bacterium Gr01-1014_31]
MAKSDKYGIYDLRNEFPTDDACLEYIFRVLHSERCSCGGRYKRLPERRQWQCSKCRYQIAPTAGTLFEKSATPLTKWFHALFVFSSAKSGLSGKQLERELNVTYKTAWRMLKLIRASLPNKKHRLLGDVEMDETYFGGKGNAGKNNQDLGKVMDDKSVILGAVERDGEIRAEVAPNAKAATIGQFLHTNVERVKTRLLTDESNRYDLVAKRYHRQSVNHSQQEYVRDDVHTNTIEGFWSHVKRSISGTHKAVSRRYLQSYLDGFVWHYNNRHSDRDRFSALLYGLLR